MEKIKIKMAMVLMCATITGHSETTPFPDLTITAGDLPFAILSDTQTTLRLERIIGRESNKSESHTLVKDLASDAPAFVAMLGDFVGWGSKESHWKYFDDLMAPIKASGIPVLGALGNHDYLGNQSKAISEACRRFPQLQKSHWYVRNYSGIALVFLDSNERALGQASWTEQKQWLTKTMKNLDEDTSINGILIMTHHPVYTNSKVTGDEVGVQKAFLPALKSSKKALAYISGHAHGYEHFLKDDGLHYIVSGGGGGPRVNYLTGKKARHQDLFTGPIPRPFNYLLITPTKDGIKVSVRGFDKHNPKLRTLDEFFVGLKTNSK